MNCIKENCDRPIQHDLTKYCKVHKCSHCDEQATYLNISCEKHKFFEGGAYTYPNDSGKFASKFDDK